MKVCVTSTGRDMGSRVDQRFRRASWLLLVDTEDGGRVQAIKNPARTAPNGAGTLAAQMVVQNGAKAVLTGTVSPEAYSALRHEKVLIYEGVSPGDTVREAIEKFTKGALKAAHAHTMGAEPGKRGREIGGGRQGVW